MLVFLLDFLPERKCVSGYNKQSFVLMTENRLNVTFLLFKYCTTTNGGYGRLQKFLSAGRDQRGRDKQKQNRA